jgi:hypothetical protein
MVGHKPSLLDTQHNVQGATLTSIKSTSQQTTSGNQAQQDEHINKHVRQTVSILVNSNSSERSDHALGSMQ